MKAVIYLLLATGVWAAEPTFQEVPEEPTTEEPKPLKSEDQAAKPGSQVSGVPRIVRQLKETEVFLKGNNKSYFIPKSNSHNTILDKIQKAMKSGSSVSFSVDPVSRKIIEMRDSSRPTTSKQTAPEAGNR